MMFPRGGWERFACACQPAVKGTAGRELATPLVLVKVLDAVDPKLDGLAHYDDSCMLIGTPF